MEGKIGGLFREGEQVGGIIDWKFEVLFAETSDGISKQYKFSKWVLTATTYWLFTETSNVIVRLYHGDSYWEGEGNIINTPLKVYDTMIHKSIEIMGESHLVDKK